MGTPDFAVPALKLLATSQFRPILVITQPDKPQGRKQKLLPPPVKVIADELGIPVIQPEDVNTPKVLAYLETLSPALIVTVAYGGYLKKRIRNLPVHGCINLHPSLLPKFRGASPVNSVLFAGDTVTGNTIFKIAKDMDAGPIFFQNRFNIPVEFCYSSLYEFLAEDGAKALLETIPAILNNTITPIKQDHSQASFSFKITKETVTINWAQPAVSIHNLVRGLAWEPGATAYLKDSLIKIMDSKVIAEKCTEKPGTIVEIIKHQGFKVATGEMYLLITKVQPAGKKIMPAHDYNLGARLVPGACFGDSQVSKALSSE